MIYEYALDPALVVNWIINKIGRYVGQFGLDQRRLVSDFPKDWKGRVTGSFYEYFEYDDSSLEFQNAQPYLDVYLQILTDPNCMVYRDVQISLDSEWIEAAIAEHNDRPFHAIFVSQASLKNLCFSTACITEKNVDDINDVHWWLPTVKPTKKSSVEIAIALRPLLQISRQIHIVDPYFDFDPNRPRFENTLIQIVHQATELPRAIQCIPSINIITGVERNNRNHQTTDQEAENLVL